MSIIHTIISWLHSHMDEKFFLPQSWHLSFATSSELVPWQLKVGGENLTIESLTSFYFQVILNFQLALPGSSTVLF